MRRAHFEALRPVCPVCRQRGQPAGPLVIGSEERATGDTLLEGVLHCKSRACMAEFPVIDGVPVIVPSVRTLISHQVAYVLAREDLSEALESLIGDCCGPGSAHDTIRQQLSDYAWDHYGDLDPEERGKFPGPGSVQGVLIEGLNQTEPAQLPPGPVLDAGCSVGRSSFVLADHLPDRLVLGIDLNLAMLRVAGRVLRDGVVRYPRRRLGVVYDRRTFPARFEGAARVDFWCCDATALPFADGTFALASSLNLLDCVSAPRVHLLELTRTLAPGARALLATPYDWAPSATPVEAWIGGHSQRGKEAGAAEPVLRGMLTDPQHPARVPGLDLVREVPQVPWHVRLHERSAVHYRVHLAVAERRDAPVTPPG